MTDSYDLVVVGGGAGGMSAARAGARRDQKTILVQDGPIGGDCTWTGCVPSKTVIAAAAGGRSFTEAFDSARAAVEAVAATEDDEVFEADGIDVHHGRAHFSDPHAIEVDGRTIQGARFVIATGASPLVPPVDGLADADPLTNETIWSLREAPDRLAVMGGGPIGCELAQALARLGVGVTVFEAEDRLLQKEEPDAAEVIAAALLADGVDLRLGTKVEKVERLDQGRLLVHGDRRSGDASEPVEVDRVLVAIGRKPSTDGLRLDRAGVRLDDRGYVRTDDHLQTSAAHVHAVGDVTGKLPFTHAADEMGRLAVGNALGRWPWQKRRFRTDRVPWVTFTSPEVGRVGLTEAEAHGRYGEDARVAELPMTELDRAVTEDRTEGFIKLIAAPRTAVGNVAGGKLVGATVVNPHGGDLACEVALVLRNHLFPAQLALSTHAYPTWAMGLQKAAGQFFMEIEGRSARPAQGG